MQSAIGSLISPVRKALVVEDEPLVASLILSALVKAGFESESANSVSTAISQLKSFDPDIVLLDINLGEGPNGIDLAHYMRREYRQTAVLFLTNYPDARSAVASQVELPEGCGYLRKESVGDVDYLFECIELVLSDNASSLRQDLDSNRPLAQLSIRQFELMRLLALGYTNQEIADRLGVVPKTVEQRLTLLFRALGVENEPGLNPRVETIRIYVQHVGLPERA
jgi:DNA-binding NarL/FixJ family response regulator